VAGVLDSLIVDFIGSSCTRGLFACGSTMHPLFPSGCFIATWRRCRGERGFLQGESLASNILLCYYFAYFLYFIFVCIFLSKIQKNSSFIVVIFACLLLVLLE
jgi:hypothetical protein